MYIVSFQIVYCWAEIANSHSERMLSLYKINQSIKFYLYSPYSQITVCLIGL